jgi:hypothetical protein
VQSKTKLKVLELDRPQHGHHAARVIARQYSSVIFIPWVFHFRPGKFGALLKMLLI